MMLRTPELLAPAGSVSMPETAMAFGATAVYAGQPRYSLRVRNNDFGNFVARYVAEPQLAPEFADTVGE